MAYDTIGMLIVIIDRLMRALKSDFVLLSVTILRILTVFINIIFHEAVPR